MPSSKAAAFTPDAYPATKLLLTEAAPKVQVMFAELTRMIDEEEGLEATPERKLVRAPYQCRPSLNLPVPPDQTERMVLPERPEQPVLVSPDLRDIQDQQVVLV